MYWLQLPCHTLFFEKAPRGVQSRSVVFDVQGMCGTENPPRAVGGFAEKEWILFKHDTCVKTHKEEFFSNYVRLSWEMAINSKSVYVLVYNICISHKSTDLNTHQGYQ